MVAFILTIVLSGVNNKNNDRINRLALNFSQDSIYTVNRGRIKTSKHILLGIAIKSLTGSEKLINILCKLGYCISYSSLTELETSAAYFSVLTKKLVPLGIHPTNILPSRVAWDNFDRRTETCGKGTIGKDTLHDTVGIIYQSLPTEEELNLIQLSDNNRIFETVENIVVNIRDTNGRRKRTFEPECVNDLPNAKQGRPQFWQSSVVLPGNPINLNRFEKINFYWMLSHTLQIPNTPMWIGYNSQIFKDDSAIQKIEYLLQINSSPTDPAVVRETLRRSLQIASECGKTYYNVTYDLAMAKIALRIQCTEEEIANLFIYFGSFHIMMSYHKAVGKFIHGSGLVNLLIDSGILANGSANTFSTGKHLNRCRKIHTVLSLALKILHFENFMIALGYSPSDIK